jgi:MFS family permease
LHVGPVGFGILRSSVAVGAFATGLILHRFPPLRRVGTLLLVAVAGFGVATLVFAFARQLWIATAALAAIGAFDMVSVVIRNGIVQLNTPDAMRGRVSAIEMVFIGASNELGEFESGALAQMMGAIGAVAAGGIATLLIVGLWAAVFPALRDSDRLAPESPS